MDVESLYEEISTENTFPQTKTGIKGLKKNSDFNGCCNAYGVDPDAFIIYAVEQLGDNEQIDPNIAPSSLPPETDEIFSGIKKTRQQEIYSQKSETPVFGGNRLSDEDGTEVINYLFDKDFDDVSIAYLKENLKTNNAVILDTPYIIELALSKILQTDKYENSNTEYYWDTPKITKNEEFVSRLDKLYEFITKERIENERLDAEDIYIPAVNAIMSNNFKSIKQNTLNEIFEELKARGKVDKTFEEFMKEKGNSKIQSNEFHPAVLIYNALEKEIFEKDFTNSALEWYENISGTGFSKCFDGSAVPPEKVEESMNGRLTTGYHLCLDGSGRSMRKNIGMGYIEYINTIKLAKDFLKNAGFNEDAETINKTIEETVNASVALNVIKQQKDKSADGTRDIFLDVIEFMNSEGYSFPPKDTQNLLKGWYLEETKSKKGGKKAYRPYGRYFKTKEESIDSKILRMYQEFGGKKKDLVVKTPAQIFKEQKIKEQKTAAERQRQQREADFQREMGGETARREELRRFEEPEYKRFQEEPGEEIEFYVTNAKIRTKTIELRGRHTTDGKSKVVGEIPKSEFIDTCAAEPTRDELLNSVFTGIVAKTKGKHLVLTDVGLHDSGLYCSL